MTDREPFAAYLNRIRAENEYKELVKLISLIEDWAEEHRSRCDKCDTSGPCEAMQKARHEAETALYVTNGLARTLKG